MPDHIDEQQVRDIARLARLKPNDEEVSQFRTHLESVLGYIDKLNEVDTDAVEPTAHPLAIRNVFGVDHPGDTLSADEALANAPARHEGFFQVPRVLDHSGGA